MARRRVQLISIASRNFTQCEIPLTKITHTCNNFCRDGKPQPDNHEGLEAGKLRQVSDPPVGGLTIEGLQEWHDYEACMAVLNNT